MLDLAQTLGVLTPRDLQQRGIPRQYLSRLTRKGYLLRIGRGLYTSPTDIQATEYHTLAVAAKRVPHGVICLLSALRFHDLTNQAPHAVWLAIEHKARPPHVPAVPLRIVRFSGEAFTAGIEVHPIENVSVRVYSPAKTVADCFKHRNKIGVDIAIEALRDTLRERKASRDEIWRYSQICRVAAIIRPYLESLS